MTTINSQEDLLRALRENSARRKVLCDLKAAILFL